MTTNMQTAIILPLYMMKLNVRNYTSCFTELLSSWYINRTTRVQENGSMGPPRIYKEGLPQDSVSQNLFKTFEMLNIFCVYIFISRKSAPDNKYLHISYNIIAQAHNN